MKRNSAIKNVDDYIDECLSDFKDVGFHWILVDAGHKINKKWDRFQQRYIDYENKYYYLLTYNDVSYGMLVFNKGEALEISVLEFID